MIRELKYFFYIFVIFLFLFLTLKFYFSDKNKKYSHLSSKLIGDKIISHSQKLIFLKDNTIDAVHYVEKTIDKDKKNFNFWKLIANND